MTTPIPVDLVREIYGEQVDAGPLLHDGKLEAAVVAPFHEPFGHKPYPTLVQKAAKLVEGISRAQAYQDGNKRLAWLSMTTFLHLNGQVISEDVTPEEAADFVLTIRGDEAGLTAAARWLNERLAPLW